MKFRFLTGDINWRNYGGKWISNKLNNSEFDYWIVLEFTNFLECTGETLNGCPYHVQINAVAPSQVSAAQLSRAFDCCGIEDEETEASDLVKIEALDSYGTHAVLWQHAGKNAYKLLREAKREAQLCDGLFGFFMDKAENKIGTTGWEAIRGDLNSALARTIASGSVTGRILGKMHGLTDADLAAITSESGTAEDDGGSRTSSGENAPGDGSS